MKYATARAARDGVFCDEPILTTEIRIDATVNGRAVQINCTDLSPGAVTELLNLAMAARPKGDP